MNRRHQGQQPTRNASTSSLNRQRGNQFNSTSSYGQNYDQDQEYETNGQYRNKNRANYSGTTGSWGDDAYEAGRAPSFRDTDYDLDGATYNRPDRHQRGMSSTYDSHETNDRNRSPSRFSSLDDDRSSYGRSLERDSADRGQDRERSWDRPFDRNTDRFNALERSRSSSERFGYPSSMDSWAHHGASEYDRYQYNSGVGRQLQPGWVGSEHEHDYDSQGGMRHSSFTGKGPKGYKRSDDRIKEEVCETLARNPRIDASDIEVKVEEACVTLSGTVESKEIKRAAEMAIENLSGVDDVKNEIRVKRADDSMFASSAGGKNATSSSTKSSTSQSKGPGHL
ncbi:BON domain-containing protein [Bacteriovorax stolpii]|uniref:Uncharacterized protein n=1 Tax=Bacteriovorax stolpii TaxID=960 RepID=A0A2K9NUQ6_BACTC|nr:BON domain-containing protein [Bacteriovorax stolpii]AUN99251.1 hypothetical protein C0V70_14285 [Bacteriovorax stolpii]QDK40768.1 BON domain-containing protein [Bacteriovorax stolpii]TDP55209.1 BON domain-containing protein [Bacteriovorax stolpii]